MQTLHDPIREQTRRKWTANASVALVALLIVGLLTAVQTISEPQAVAETGAITRTPVSIDSLPTVQINGVVWSQAVSGNIVYAGGSFTAARPAGAAPGANQTTRNNMVAYDITTGAMTSFNPNVNGVVRAVAVAPNGTVYVAGDFIRAQGVTRNKIAAFNPNGTLISTFAPVIDGAVRALTVTNDTVYAGGSFTTVNGVARGGLAAIDAAGGGLVGFWDPVANDQVTAMTLAPDGGRVIVGGRFTTIDGAGAYGLGAISTSTGSLVPFATNAVVRNAGPNGDITSLSTDGTSIYGTGYDFGSGANFEGTFRADPTTGQLTWMEDCHGDTYGAFSRAGAVYTVSHAHDCSTIGGFPQKVFWHRALAFTFDQTQTVQHNKIANYVDFFGRPAPSLLSWDPLLDPGSFTGQNQAAWSITGNGSYLTLGGEFPTVNGIGQQGLVRFAVRTVPGNPNKHGPELSSTTMTPTVSSPAAGTVKVTFPSNWDRDDGTLTYRVVRDGNLANPVFTVDTPSTFWNLPTQTYTDTAVPGGTHTYRIYVKDPSGNQTASPVVSIDVVAGGNTAPTAAFTSAATGLDATFNGLGSSDPDGTIVSYAWTFGDGTTGTGSSPAHTYPTSGTYPVTLTVTDNDGGTGTISRSITVTDTTNSPPTAAFTATTSGLQVAVNGSGSADPDGSIADYAWDFGDGGSGSTVTSSHTYATAGTYTVRLTVTDNLGATGTATRSVTVSNAAGPIAADAFGRTVATGFGAADTGGNWTGSTAALSVNGGAGRISIAANTGPSAALTTVSATGINAVVDVALDKRPAGGNAYLYLDARKSGTSGYRARVTVATSGALTLSLVRVTNNAETTLSTIATGLTYVVGTSMRVRLSLTGSTPTALSAKIWPATSAEPTAWTLTASDSTAERQGPGGIGLGSFLSSAATNGPITLSVDNLSVVAG